MITTKDTVAKSKELLMSTIDNEAVILGISSGTYFGLNEIGTRIWSLLDQPVKVISLIKLLLDEYDEEEKVITEHIIEFLNALYSKSLIVLVDENK
jgi:hypothetical protein